jgi:hypothetical protein
MTYKHKSWATVRLEASPPEPGTAEPEQVAASSLASLGLNGPEYVACQSPRYPTTPSVKGGAVSTGAAGCDLDRP